MLPKPRLDGQWERDPWRLFLQISNFVRRECELLAPSDGMANEWQPDSTTVVQLCSFGENIRYKLKILLIKIHKNEPSHL